MSARAPIQLILDEMFSPTIAATLRERGHTVIAVAERVDLRAMTDPDVFAWAATHQTWLLTENVKDFRPILLQATQTGTPTARLLFTSSRTFPRSRNNPGPLIEALHTWLDEGPPPPPIVEDWLTEPGR
jgi:predicted nuclease of predicted toxin-antitoxin system